ncbi:urea carboxylase-associated family protein [Oceanibaculum sp.]|uniref:urea carboxylase-associated family protein n=1 Tax=Oceanibaculum sp. TaxID=1903597 RepID=UPI002586BDEE|nr:urea carboxylase-associated family protein [Oceanibaculum sp.]
MCKTEEVQLLNSEWLGTNATLNNPISSDGTPVLGRRYTVPAREGRAVRVARGQTIRIVNTHGTQVCDTWAFSQANLQEFMSWEHGRVMISRVNPVAGDPLGSNRRRPILQFLEDTSPGIHDTIYAACDLYRYRILDVAGYHDNCSDNLRMAMAAIGLTVPEVPQPLNLWMNIPITEGGKTEFLPTVSKAGDHVLLRAEMDVIVVMSACPQDIIQINHGTPADIHFIVEPA